MLIVVEGCDGSGKDTLADGIAEVLSYDRFSFPDYTTDLGKRIKAHLRGEETYPPDVFQAMQVANKLERLKLLEDAEDHMRDVVLTRYWQSAEVYGALDGVPREWSRRIHSTLPWAQLNILVDIDPEEALRRQVARGLPVDRYEGDLSKAVLVSHIYQSIWNEYACPRWIVVDGNGSKAETLARAMTAIRPYVAERRY